MNENEQIIIYQEKGREKNQIEVRLESETVWLSQKLMADLFDKNSDTIGLHIKNIYKEGELNKKSTADFFSVGRMEGKRKVNRN